MGEGTCQYVKDVFYVNLSQNRRKVKVKGVYVDVINIYGAYFDMTLRWFQHKSMQGFTTNSIKVLGIGYMRRCSIVTKKMRMY